MPIIGSITGSAGYGRANTAGLPGWITVAGSLGTLSDTQRSNTFTISAEPGPGAISVTYAVVAGSLPAGASLNSTTGLISGFEAVASTTTSSFTIQATNNAGLTTDRNFSITINSVTITFNSPAAGSLGEFSTGSSFNITYSASVSTGSLSYSVLSGSIPSGTSLNSSTGVHSGTPNAAGTFNWVIRATGTSGSAQVIVDRSFSASAVAIISSFAQFRDNTVTNTTYTIKSPNSATSYTRIVQNGPNGRKGIYLGLFSFTGTNFFGNNQNLFQNRSLPADTYANLRAVSEVFIGGLLVTSNVSGVSERNYDYYSMTSGHGISGQGAERSGSTNAVYTRNVNNHSTGNVTNNFVLRYRTDGSVNGGRGWNDNSNVQLWFTI